MAQLFIGWQRGAAFGLILAMQLGMAAAFSFFAVAIASKLLVWLGVEALAHWAQPYEVDAYLVLSIWKFSAVLWVPLALHWGAPLLRDMVSGWERDDARELGLKKTGSGTSTNETKAT